MGYNVVTNAGFNASTGALVGLSPVSNSNLNLSLLNYNPNTAWSALGTYSKGTAITNDTITLGQKTEVGTWTKIEDLIGSATLQPAVLSTSLDLPTGVTGKTLLENYRSDIAKNNPWKLDKLFNPKTSVLTPWGYYNTAKELYGIQEKYREKSNTIKDTIANTPYDININGFDTTLKNYGKAGISFQDINLTSTTKVIKEGYSYTDELGQKWNVSPQTETTQSLGLNLGFKNAFDQTKKLNVESGNAGKNILGNVALVSGKVGIVGTEMLALNYVGVLGGSATEGGLIGRGVTNVATWFPKVGTVVEFGAKPAVQLTLVGASGVYRGYQGIS